MSAQALATAVETVLGRAPGDGVLRRGDGREVRRALLALDPPPDPRAATGADAILLHRSHGYEPPAGVALLGYHDAFDEALGLHGRIVAEALGATGYERLGPKLALADGLRAGAVEALFGCGEHGGRGGRAALASAMSPALVEQAAEAGARVYVTGRWRPSAAAAVTRTGIAVAVVGHRPAEAWALGELARRLRALRPGVRVELSDPSC